MVDAEQVGAEMRATRAAIDRKIDTLASLAAEAKQRTLSRAIPVFAAVAAALVIVAVWRRRAASHATSQAVRHRREQGLPRRDSSCRDRFVIRRMPRMR